MSLKDMTQEQIEESSMINLVTLILEEEREAIDFNDLFNRIATMKGFSEKQKEEYISQFYTDMNIDGSFMTIGTNRWGLRKWYPVEQMEEELASLSQKRKKKKKKPSKLVDEELETDDYDDEDLEDDLDLTEDDLDLDEDDDDDYDGDYEDDDLDEEEEEIIEDDISFIGDEEEED